MDVERFIESVLGPLETFRYRAEIDLSLPKPPSDMSDEELMATFQDCLSSMAAVGKSVAVVRYLIGIVANEIYRRKHLWSEFSSFDEFVRSKIAPRVGIAARTIHQARRIADNWPALDPEEVAEIGITKLDVLTRVSRQSQPGYEKLLAKARELSVEELERWVSGTHHVELEVKVIRISKSFYQELIGLSQNADLVAIVGSSRVEEILKAAVAEARSSWGV